MAQFLEFLALSFHFFLPGLLRTILGLLLLQVF